MSVFSPWDNFPNLVSTTDFDINRFSEFCNRENKIIDIGCGYGRICKILEDNGYKKNVGIDSSLVLLNKAKSKLDYTELIFADSLNIPLANAVFDAGISFGIINCLYKDNDLRKYAQECGRILKNGAYLFINEFTRNDSEYFDNKYRDGSKIFDSLRVFKSNNGIIYRHYSIAEILLEFDKEFDLIECNAKEFLSQNHNRKVAGFSMILRKIVYKSQYRKMRHIEKNILCKNKEWKFDKNVSLVFDFHVRRSIPCYQELQDIIANLSLTLLEPNSTIVDLGAATGETILKIDNINKNKNFQYIGIDNSKLMLAKAKNKCKSVANCSFILSDIKNCNIPKSDLIISIYTMHFIEPIYRYELFSKIRSCLNNNSYFILCEKIQPKNNFDDLYMNMHEKWKEQYFERSEIVSKKQNLINIMFPIKLDTTINDLHSLGFKTETFFQWFNFIGILGKWDN